MYYYYNIYDAFYYLLIRTRVFRKSKFISFSELKIYSNNMNSIIKVYYETYYKINLHSLKLDKFNVFCKCPSLLTNYIINPSSLEIRSGATLLRILIIRL